MLVLEKTSRNKCWSETYFSIFLRPSMFSFPSVFVFHTFRGSCGALGLLWSDKEEIDQLCTVTLFQELMPDQSTMCSSKTYMFSLLLQKRTKHSQTKKTTDPKGPQRQHPAVGDPCILLMNDKVLASVRRTTRRNCCKCPAYTK